jgi:hypothetical protein
MMKPVRRFRIEKHYGMWNVYDRHTRTNTRFFYWVNAISYATRLI